MPFCWSHRTSGDLFSRHTTLKKQSRPVGCRSHRTSLQPFEWNSETLSGDSGSGSPAWPKPCRRFGVERLSLTHPRCTLNRIGLSETPPTFSLRKEVIQPQVLLRLPCYDFTPIMSHTLERCLPCGLACALLVQPTFVM